MAAVRTQDLNGMSGNEYIVLFKPLPHLVWLQVMNGLCQVGEQL
jgi:hypothetical protein